MRQASKRDIIIDVALTLFYKNGFNATGVEKIRETAGVSKKTLYNHFKSKEELILAVLRRRDEQFRNEFMRNIERLGSTPQERLLCIFDAIDLWFRSEGFYGCMFINASAEFGDQDNPCHAFCSEHNRLVLEYIKNLASEAGAHNSDELAEQLIFLVHGAIVNAHVCGDIDAGLRAKQMSQVFIEVALNKEA